MLKVLVLFSYLLFHPVHVTLTSIDYISDKNCFNVFVKMYLDDFILDCKKYGEDIIVNAIVKDDPATKKTVEKYILDNIVIDINNDKLSGKLKNVTIDENEIKMNLEFRSKGKPDKILIRNSVMTRMYKDQSNMVILRINDFEEGFKLTPDLMERTFYIK